MIGGSYNVTIKIGFFPKKGTMNLRVMDGNRVNGTLSLFGRNESVNGTMEGKSVNLAGNIKLPVGVTTFEATGTIDGNTIKFTLDTNVGFYKMTATRV